MTCLLTFQLTRKLGSTSWPTSWLSDCLGSYLYLLSGILASWASRKLGHKLSSKPDGAVTLLTANGTPGMMGMPLVTMVGVHRITLQGNQHTRLLANVMNFIVMAVNITSVLGPSRATSCSNINLLFWQLWCNSGHDKRKEPGVGGDIFPEV